MHRLIREEAHGRWRGPSLTAVWLGGSIPNASFAALALPLLVGSAVIAKTARHDRVSPTLFQRSLRDADPTLAAALHVTDENEIPALADAMVVYGSDATVSALRSRCAAGVRFVGHGPQLSAAAVGPAAELEHAAGALASDRSLFDGRGCLSPAHIFVDASDSKRPERFMELLCDALRKLAVELPRGRLDDAEHALLREIRARLAAVGHPLDISPHGTDWAVWLNPPAALGRPGLLRHVGVSPVAGLPGLDPNDSPPRTGLDPGTGMALASSSPSPSAPPRPSCPPRSRARRRSTRRAPSSSPSRRARRRRPQRRRRCRRRCRSQRRRRCRRVARR